MPSPTTPLRAWPRLSLMCAHDRGNPQRGIWPVARAAVADRTDAGRAIAMPTMPLQREAGWIRAVGRQDSGRAVPFVPFNRRVCATKKRTKLPIRATQNRA